MRLNTCLAKLPIFRV